MTETKKRKISDLVDSENETEVAEKLFGERWKKYSQNASLYNEKKEALKEMKKQWEETVQQARAFAEKRPGASWRTEKYKEKWEKLPKKRTDPERLKFEKQFLEETYPATLLRQSKREHFELPEKIQKLKDEKLQAKRKAATQYKKMQSQADLYDEISKYDLPVENTAVPEKQPSPKQVESAPVEPKEPAAAPVQQTENK